MSRRLKSLSPHLIVLLAYSLFTIGFTYPLAFQIGSALPGIGDTYLYIWDLVWVRRALFEFGTNPFFTREIYYPSGISLYFHSLILGSDLLTLPLQFALGDVPAYLVMTLVMFVLSGYGGYLLGYELTRNHQAAIVSGFILTFAPYHLAHLYYSHFDLMPLQWLPLFALAAKKWFDQPSLKHLLLSATFLIWTSITDWYYALYALFFFGIYSLYRAIRARTWRPLRGAVLLGIFYLVALSPVLLPMLNETGAWPVSFRGVQEADKFSADLLSYFVPSTLHPLWGAIVAPLSERLRGGFAERTLFLGFTPLALALVALGLRRGRELGLWLIIALLFLIMSLGPILHVGGETEFGLEKSSITLPYALTFQTPVLASVFAVARSISRFGIMVLLGVAVLAAAGLDELMRRLPGRASLAVFTVALTAIALEFIVAPIPTTVAQVPAPMRVLAATPEPFAVLDLPFELRTGGEAMYDSTVHHKPIMNAYHSRLLPFPAVNGISSMRSVLPIADPADIVVEPTPSAAEVLSYFDVRYIALHKRTVEERFTANARRWISRNFGPLAAVSEDDRIALYALPPVNEAPMVVSFAQGWYEPERFGGGAMWRWMQNDAHLVIYCKEPANVTLSVEAVTLAQSRHLQVSLDGAHVHESLIASDEKNQIVLPNLALHAGANELVLHSVEPAQMPFALGLNDDHRFFTLAFSNLVVESKQ